MKKLITLIIICAFMMTQATTIQASKMSSQRFQVEAGITFVDESGDGSEGNNGNESGDGSDSNNGNESGDGSDSNNGNGIVQEGLTQLPTTGDRKQSGLPLIGGLLLIGAFYHLRKHNQSN